MKSSWPDMTCILESLLKSMFRCGLKWRTPWRKYLSLQFHPAQGVVIDPCKSSNGEKVTKVWAIYLGLVRQASIINVSLYNHVSFTSYKHFMPTAPKCSPFHPSKANKLVKCDEVYNRTAKGARWLRRAHTNLHSSARAACDPTYLCSCGVWSDLPLLVRRVIRPTSARTACDPTYTSAHAACGPTYTFARAACEQPEFGRGLGVVQHGRLVRELAQAAARTVGHPGAARPRVTEGQTHTWERRDEMWTLDAASWFQTIPARSFIRFPAKRQSNTWV